MNREILESPFDESLIRTRRGPSGRTFSYVEGAEYIRKLNEAFDGKWSFDIVEYKILEKDVIVIGKLEAEGLIKVSFGGTSITTNYQTGEALNLADDLKAAATDALKKAASLFGVGLHLYSKEPLEHPEPASSRPISAPASRPAAPQPPRETAPVEEVARKQEAPAPQKPSEGRPARKGSALTERQLNAINAIARSLGWSSEALRQQSVDSYEVPPEELTKADASAFIGELQKLVTKSAA